MISRELFIETIHKIQLQEERIHKFESALNDMGDGHYIFDVDNQYLCALREVLAADMHDTGEWIEWWLYEAASDRTVTWEEDGKEISKDLTTIDALYDFIRDNECTIPDDKLPITDLDDGVEKPFLPHKAIALSDFHACFDSVLRYMDTHDVALHIIEDWKPKYVLLNIKNYIEMISKTEATDSAKGEGSI